MGYGTTCPSGSLPAYSVDHEAEAKQLIVMSCPMGSPGVYYARELAEKQTLANLQAFSDRLDKAHDVLVARGQCTCEASPTNQE